MDCSLSETGKESWNKRLVRQRKAAGKLQKHVAAVVGRDSGGVSKFESGDEATLRAWFRNGLAETYEAEIGLAPATLGQWLEEAQAIAAPSADWHPAFPGVTLADARISPRLKVEGLEPPPSTVPALVEHLARAGEGSGSRVKVRVAATRGVGRSTLVAWLENCGLPGAIDIVKPEDAPRGRKPKWMVLPALDPEPGVKLVDVEPLPWNADEVGALADRLVELGKLEPGARARVARVEERLRTSNLAVGPATAIELVADAVCAGASGDDIVATVASAQWALVQKAGGLDGTDPAWLFRFWGQRRIDCAGPGWLVPTEEEAVASMTRVCARVDAAPLDRARLRARLAVLRSSTNAKRATIEEEIVRQLSVPGAAEVVAAMRTAGLLVDAQRWLQAPDPSLAEAFAAVDLADRLGAVEADPHFTWALDPSWRTLLRRIGSVAADPTPLVAAWRRLPAWARLQGSLALLHLFAGTPVRHALADAVREVHAVALWSYLATPGSDDPLQVQLLPLLGGAMREVPDLFRAVSERWAGELGYLEPESMQALASRVPADVREAVEPRGSPLSALMQRNGSIPPDQYDRVALLCLAPWQCPPHDDDTWDRWWLASSVASFSMRPLPEADTILEAAARNGHLPARAALTGAAKPMPEPDGEPEARLRWDETEGGYVVTTLPRRHDFWRNLGWATRCRWVGTAGTREINVARFVELVTERPVDRDDRPLLDAAARVGRDVVVEALKRLSMPGPEDIGTWLKQPAWVFEEPARAGFAGRLAAAAGAGAALVELHEALGRWLGERVPAVEAGGLGSRRSARIHSRELDPADVAARAAVLRRVARVGSGNEPVWLSMAAELVTDLMTWEVARHEIAVALADLGNPKALRARALSGAGWALPPSVLEHTDFGFRRAEVFAMHPGPSLVWLARHPVAEGDATAFLAALRTRGLERAAESGMADDGIWFPGPSGVEGLEHLWVPEWLQRRRAELDALPELGASARGNEVRRTLAVVHWLCERRGWLGTRRADLSDGLWEWLAQLVDAWPSFSPARTVMSAVDVCVRVDAARELMRRCDEPFLAELWAADDGAGAHDDPRWEAQTLVRETLKTHPGLRAAVWRHAKNGPARSSALHAEEAIGAPAPWAREEQHKRREHWRERLAKEPDPLQRVAAALWERSPFDVDEAERIVAEWWTGPEILDFPARIALEERRPFSAYELFDYVARRLRAGSMVLAPQVRALWEHLLTLPLSRGRSLGDVVASELPASAQPPSVIETVIELLRLTPQAEGVLTAAWHREDSEVVPVLLAEVGWSVGSWADSEDLAAPVRRRDIHRAWILACAEETLDSALLAVEAVEAGFLRALLRERLARVDPERALPWIVHRLESALPADLGGRLDWVWARWAEIRPAEAWAWLQRRCDEPGGEEALLHLAVQAVVLVEGAVPAARRWVGERVARTG